MSWLTVTFLYGFAVGASASSFTPVTRIANSADAAKNEAASPTPEAAIAEAAAASKYDAATVAIAAEAADLAASGAPVFLWKETVTRHIPEKNTWEISVQTQTDYQADIDYEPDDFEAKIKGLTTQAPPPGNDITGTQTDIGGIPLLSFGSGAIPTGLPEVDGSPQSGRLTTAMAYSTGVPEANGSNDDMAQTSVSVYPAPPEATGEEASFGRQYPHPHRASKVENAARITPRPGADIWMSLVPKFQLTSSKRTYAWDINTEIASMQNQEVYFPVSDEVGHDIIKASVGTSPNPMVKIAGATETLSVGGSPVTYKGHTFTLAPEGIKVGTQTFSMAAIAPAYNTDYQAVLTIDENIVTFVKDAANPTVMTAEGLTAQLGGPPLVTGVHQILYNTDGSLVLDGTLSVEPTMIPKPGMPVPAGEFLADAQGKSPGGSSGSSGEVNRGPVWSEDGSPDNNGANSRPTSGGLPGGSFSGLGPAGSQNPSGSLRNSLGSQSSAASGPGASGASAVTSASGSSRTKNATAAAANNGTAKPTTSSHSAANTVAVERQWMMAICSVMTFLLAVFCL